MLKGVHSHIGHISTQMALTIKCFSMICLRVASSTDNNSTKKKRKNFSIAVFVRLYLHKFKYSSIDISTFVRSVLLSKRLLKNDSDENMKWTEQMHRERSRAWNEEFEENKRKSLLVTARSVVRVCGLNFTYISKRVLHPFHRRNQLFFFLGVLLIRGHRRYGNEMIQHSTWDHCLRSFATLGGIKCIQ